MTAIILLIIPSVLLAHSFQNRKLHCSLSHDFRQSIPDAQSRIILSHPFINHPTTAIQPHQRKSPPSKPPATALKLHHHQPSHGSPPAPRRSPRAPPLSQQHSSTEGDIPRASSIPTDGLLNQHDRDAPHGTATSHNSAHPTHERIHVSQRLFFRCSWPCYRYL